MTSSASTGVESCTPPSLLACFCASPRSLLSQRRFLLLRGAAMRPPLTPSRFSPGRAGASAPVGAGSPASPAPSRYSCGRAGRSISAAREQLARRPTNDRGLLRKRGRRHLRLRLAAQPQAQVEGGVQEDAAGESSPSERFMAGPSTAAAQPMFGAGVAVRPPLRAGPSPAAVQPKFGAGVAVRP
jgi:hypothetical protein